LRKAATDAEADAVDAMSEAARRVERPTRGALNAKRLIEILRQGDWPRFEAAMVRFTHLRPKLVHKIVHDPSGMRLAVLCSAYEVSKGDFASLFLLTRKPGHDAGVVDAAKVRKSLEVYGRISTAHAQRALARWRGRPIDGRRSGGRLNGVDPLAGRARQAYPAA